MDQDKNPAKTMIIDRRSFEADFSHEMPLYRLFDLINNLSDEKKQKYSQT